MTGLLALARAALDHPHMLSDDEKRALYRFVVNTLAPTPTDPARHSAGYQPGSGRLSGPQIADQITRQPPPHGTGNPHNLSQAAERDQAADDAAAIKQMADAWDKRMRSHSTAHRPDALVHQLNGRNEMPFPEPGMAYPVDDPRVQALLSKQNEMPSPEPARRLSPEQMREAYDQVSERVNAHQIAKEMPRPEPRAPEGRTVPQVPISEGQARALIREEVARAVAEAMQQWQGRARTGDCTMGPQPTY